jgi:catechol 2,3-dioxygenase-like lactoylglutathione lyase family enzyme
VLCHLHHVQLAMPPGREGEARAFFAGVLGMVEVEKPPALAGRGGAWFRDGGVEIHLGVEDPFAPARTAHPGLVVEDLDEAARRVATTGQDITWDADLPGFRRFHAHDPFGNRLEFLQSAP